VARHKPPVVDLDTLGGGRKWWYERVAQGAPGELARSGRPRGAGRFSDSPEQGGGGGSSMAGLLDQQAEQD
jgi:hypothetical protein